MSALLLAAGRAGSEELPVVAVRPEGFEDIDCELSDSSLLLVQTKERGVGARNIAAAEVAEIIAHAARAMTLGVSPIENLPPAEVAPASTPGATRRLAIVTDGQFGSGLPATGWEVTLAEALANLPNTAKLTKDLLTPLRTELAELSLSPDLAHVLVAHTHLVSIPTDLSSDTVAHLQSGLGLHPAVAGMVRAELLRDLGEVAAGQFHADLHTAERRYRADIDALADQILQAVNIADLEEAVQDGVCEPATYVSKPAVNTGAFLRGVDVNPAHIAADLDVVRPEEVTSILNGLSQRRHVLIAGPSGSGKSALLWRAARTIDRGPRVVRVLSVADSREAGLLVRHVRRQRPSAEMPVLVCADNLGRDRTQAWPQARDRLLELPGVMILGAARHEDVTPDISSDAEVVDARLADTAARDIYHRIEQSGTPMMLAFEEAAERADGLLMEFVALATTGNRIREVLAKQVASLAGPQLLLQREALRVICAAHVLGFAVSADRLPAVLNAEPYVVGDVLNRLKHEHLLTADGHHWHGLHDLRTEVLLELLHTAPPPTLSATYARALSAIALSGRPAAARRAAARVAKQVAAIGSGLASIERLATIIVALDPITRYLGEELGGLVLGSSSQNTERAGYAAGLLEAADRLDSVAYAHAVLPDIVQHLPRALDPASTASLAYSIAVDGLSARLEQLQPFVSFAQSLPVRPTKAAEHVAVSLRPAIFLGLVETTDLTSAIRLCEAAEGLIHLTAVQAQQIYHAHVPALSDPPGAFGSLHDADLRAQLTATLAVLADLRGPAVATIFGPPLARAEDAVASDAYGVRVEVAFSPAVPVPEVVANSARATTYDNSRMFVVRAVAFLRRDGASLASSAYKPSPGEDPASAHAQAILLARRLFDACPEADLVEVEMWQADCKPIHVIDHDEGVLSLRAGVLPREQRISRNVAFQAAVTEALTPADWTTRLRLQAQIARDLGEVMRELPIRLRENDNRRLREKWIARVEDIATRVAQLPRRPIDAAGTARTPMITTTMSSAGSVDQALRARDEAKDALEHITSCLTQIAHGLGQDQMVIGAGSRLAAAPARLEVARRQGAPSYASIGDALPQELDMLSALHGRLLTAVKQPRIATALRVKRSEQELDALLSETAQEAAEPDSAIASDLLAASEVAAQTSIITDPDPMPPWRTKCVLATVTFEDWNTAVAALQGWTAEAREQVGLSGRIVVLATVNDVPIPLGMKVFGAFGHALLIPEDDFARYHRLNGLPMMPGRKRALVRQLITNLVDYSYALVRNAHRDAMWHPDPAPLVLPEHVARDTREVFARELDVLPKHVG